MDTGITTALDMVMDMGMDMAMDYHIQQKEGESRFCFFTALPSSF